jgi:regulator of replication initiation timing
VADKAWQDMTERERSDHLFAVVTAQAREISELRVNVEASVAEIGTLRRDVDQLKEKLSQAEALAAVL